MRDEIKAAAERLVATLMGDDGYTAFADTKQHFIAELQAAEERGRREMREEAASRASVWHCGDMTKPELPDDWSNCDAARDILSIPDKASR